MDPDDPDIYSAGIMEKYINRPDTLKEMCYVDFAANYVNSTVRGRRGQYTELYDTSFKHC